MHILPRHPRRRLRGLRRGRRPARGRRARAAAPPLRRRSPRRGLRIVLGANARTAEERPRCHGRPDLPRTGLLDLSELDELVALDRPEHKEEPWVPVAPTRLPPTTARRLFAELRRARCSSTTRTTRSPARRGVRRRTAAATRSARHEEDALPHQRRLASRAGADARRPRTGKQTVCPRRAQGALRRAAQHRVGPRRWKRPASTSSTAFRRSRPTRRGRWSCATNRTGCAVTRTSAPATTTGHGPRCTRTSASSPRTRRSPPTSPTCSTT